MSKKVKKPNVLFIMTDQHRYECLGCHGFQLVKTPNLDKMMEDGVDFQRTYAQSAICMPSRVTAFTGQYLHTHGIQSNSNKADMGHLTMLPNYLRNYGYETAVVGKNHAGHHQQIGFDYARVCAGIHQGENNDYRDYLREFDLEQYWCGDQAVKAYDAYVSEIPYKHSVEAWTGDESINYLQNRDKSKPFFLWTSFERPHSPTCVPKDNPFPYNPDEIVLPTYDERWYNLPDTRRPGCENNWNVFQSGEEKLKQAIANYLSLISMIDDQIGRVVAELDSQGELENTIILFTADHGDFCGENGQFGKNVSTYDVLYRIPLLWYWKGKTAREQFHELTEMVDVMPTILDMCEIPTPPTVQGKSLAGPILASTERCGTPWLGKDAVFFETPYIKTVRTKTHKLSVCWKGNHSWGELFDLNNDPREMNNLYNNPEFSWIQRELEERLLRWFIETQQPQVHGFGREVTHPDLSWRWFHAEQDEILSLLKN